MTTSRALPSIGRGSSLSTRSICCTPLIMRVFSIVGRVGSMAMSAAPMPSFSSSSRIARP